MHLPETLLRPTPRQLKQFALALPLAMLLIGWTMRTGRDALLIAALLSGAAAVVGWYFPAVVKPVYVGVSLLAYPIGLVVSELVMLAVYFGLLTPIALFFRITGRDALERKIDRDAQTYWRAKKQPSSARSYLRRW